MLIKNLKNCKEIIAGDDSILREILHPKKDDARISYSIAHAIVKPGKITLPHILKSSEVYYILEGKGIMFIDGESEAVIAGQAIYISPNSKQYIKNTSDNNLKFLCIVDPAWKSEDEKIITE